ncbi:tyrosine-type recombinase/integrase [Neorhizobium galegae]|uniref:tyrosine-type recombinase/integrase n=1 Tax=Neorhizobium galegae TaxID=399 RepID=UPI000621B241|nr:integrase arm-type DNA-binding domain-containing protein [Neorhizobium galegae]KAB1126319.1 tyrosine-type recombinase/integrase [Neorhizobium galegae]MCQ1805290.1 tyrosine-type recombinase/integrase [Neorhizobium galegae]CDZ56052.1 Putative P4-family integrase [Neorhizobium galegae bv. orientalis]
MARELHRLSTRGIEAAIKKGEEGYEVLRDGGGLSLAIDRFGARWSFLFTSPVTKKRREMGLGPLATMSLADAREIAQGHRGLIAKGIDPLHERERKSEEARRDAVTFEQCANDTRDILARKWTGKNAIYLWDKGVRDCGDLRKMLVKDIRGRDIAAALAVFDLPPVRPSTKRFVHSVIKRTMDTAIAAELREDNPALMSRISRLTSLEQKRGHNASMPYTDVPAFVAKLRENDSRAARCLELIIRTGVRKSEATEATWDEMDFAKGLWIIPAERTKQRREHVVPLTHRVLDILRRQRAQYDAVYDRSSKGANARSAPAPSTPAYVWADDAFACMSHGAFQHLETNGATVHGFRSSLREYLGDETTVSWNTAEEVLGHKVGDATAKAYRRSSGIAKRLAALQYWGDFIDGVSNKNVKETSEAVAKQGVEEQAA